MVVREGFRKMLELEGSFEVAGEAQDGRQAVALVKKFRPEVVLMDIAMPQLNGLEATRQILKELPATKVIMLSAHSDDAYVANAIESGAVGFLLKQTSANDVCRAIREVHTGKTFFSSSISSVKTGLIRQCPAARDCSKKASRLTSREMEVLPLIAEGKANKGDGGGTRHRPQDRREASRAPDGKARHPRYRRSHPLRHQRGHHREQRPTDDCLNLRLFACSLPG